MLKNLLICCVGVVFLALFVVSRTEKKVVPLQQIQQQNREYKLLTMTLDKPEVKLCAVLPSMDAHADVLEVFKQTFSLVQKDLQRKDLKYRYTLIFEQIPRDSDQARKLVARQFTKEKMDAFIGFEAQTQKIFKPLLDKDEVVYVTMPLAHLDKASSKTLMGMVHPHQLATSALSLLHKKGSRRVLFITDDSVKRPDFERSVFHEAVNQKLVVKNMRLTKKDKNFGEVFKNASAFNADGYLVLLDANKRLNFLRQLYKMQKNVPFVLIREPEDFTRLGGFEGIYFTDLPLPQERFVKWLKKENKTMASEHLMGAVYDSIMLAVQAFEKTDHKSAAVTQFKKTQKYTGVSGMFVKNDDGMFTPQPVIKKVINDKAFIIEEQ